MSELERNQELIKPELDALTAANKKEKEPGDFLKWVYANYPPRTANPTPLPASITRANLKKVPFAFVSGGFNYFCAECNLSSAGDAASGRCLSSRQKWGARGTSTVYAWSAVRTHVFPGPLLTHFVVCLFLLSVVFCRATPKTNSNGNTCAMRSPSSSICATRRNSRAENSVSE